MSSVTFMLLALLLWHFATDVDWRLVAWARTIIIVLCCASAVISMIFLNGGL